MIGKRREVGTLNIQGLVAHKSIIKNGGTRCVNSFGFWLWRS